MKQTTEQGPVSSAGSFLGSVADLITVKGVILILYLSVVTGVSVVAGEAVHGLLVGLGLVSVLAAAVVFERVHYERTDVVGVAITGLVLLYTALEYVGVLQNLWFPTASALVVLATSGYGAWRDNPSDSAEFVENLDIVGLHGGVLLLLYSLLLAGAPLEFIYAPVFPAVLLFFALSLLVTTIAYATRSPSVASDELHHRLVSVVRGLEEIDDEEDREKLGRHVRAVAQALTGVSLPSRVTVDEGPVPVVLPASGPPVYESDGLEDLLSKLEESGITGYAVDGGDVLLIKNGTPTRHYLAEENRFGHPDALPEGRFKNASVYPAAYVFVDAVESVIPMPGADVEGDEWAEDAVERVEDVGENVESLLDESGDDTESTTVEGESDTEGSDAETSDEDESESESPKIDVGGDELDLDEMFEKADEMFD